MKIIDRLFKNKENTASSVVDAAPVMDARQKMEMEYAQEVFRRAREGSEFKGLSAIQGWELADNMT